MEKLEMILAELKETTQELNKLYKNEVDIINRSLEIMKKDISIRQEK